MKLGFFFLFFHLLTSVLGQQSPLQLEDERGYKHVYREAPKNQILQNQDYLPDNVIPKSYVLKIRPILDPSDPTGDQWTAPGHIDIEIEPTEATSKIVFHRHPTLKIDEALVTVTEKGSSGPLKIKDQSDDEPNDFHTINMDRNLVAGKRYTISIDFVAPVSESTSGLYRAHYKDDAGKDYRMATTQFEKFGARQAFPCFDEPRWKTPFTITLGYKKDAYHSLCNSNKKKTADPDPKLTGWVWDEYDTTVRMPTYLVAIIISDFDFHEASKEYFGDRPVRIYGEKRYIAPGGNKENGGGKYAADASAKLIAFLEKKYLYKYEMPKMDSVAIPNPYFAAGAMENWGLNTYRENYLIHFTGEQTWLDKQRITSVLSHELAHQWWGNLITCKTWENLWLNEGFATYIADVGVTATHKEWEDVREALWGNVQNALNQDVTSTMPLYSYAPPSVITYDKGGSLIRMMEGFLGEETLTKGLVNFLKAKAYEAAVQDELFEHLTNQSVIDKKLPEGKSIKQIMDTWTLQPGFPLIRVSKVGSSLVVISQERFQPVSKEPEPGKPGLMYEVPIAHSTPDSPKFADTIPKLWLSKNTVSTSIKHDTSKWIVVNPDAMGYYRVLYDDALFELILAQLKTKRDALSANSRSQLIDDYFSLALHGHIPISKALEVTTILKNNEGIEENFLVWYPLFTQLTKALTMFQAHNGGLVHSLSNYLRPKLEEVLGKLSWEQKPTDEGTLVVFRTKLLDWACALKSPTCRSLAKMFVDMWMLNENNNMFQVDVQQVMYCAAAAGGGQKEFDFFLEQFTKAPVGTFKTHRAKLLNALSCTEDVALLNKLLTLAIDETSAIGKTKADALTIIQKVAGNPVGRPLIIKFLDDNFNAVTKSLDGGVKGVGSILVTYSGYLTKDEDKTKFQDFVTKRATDLKPVEGDVKIAIQLIDGNVNWISANYKEMDDWFNSH